MLLQLAFVAMVGSAVRVFFGGDSRRLPWATGVWAGLGVWVSTEFLVPLFMLLAALLVVWVWKGAMATCGRWVSFGLLAMTGIAVLLEHPPAALMTVAYDRVSVVHVLVSAVVVACGGDGPDVSSPPGEFPSFASLLRSGNVPGWLEPSPATSSTPGLRVYEVAEEGDPVDR